MTFHCTICGEESVPELKAEIAKLRELIEIYKEEITCWQDGTHSLEVDDGEDTRETR